MTPHELFTAFTACSKRRDGAAFAELFTPNGVLELPFAQLRYAGRDAIRARVVDTWKRSPVVVTAFDDVVLTGTDGGLVAEYVVRGATWAVPAILRLGVEAGQIALFREYLDPIALAAARSSPARELLRRYHAAMQAKDADALAELYAADAIHEFSFYTPNRPPQLVGREAIRASYREGWRDHPLDIHAITDVVVFEAADPEVVFGQWRATATLRTTRAPVTITGFIGLRVREERIVHTWDFMDGLGVAHALGRLPFAK
ncbi:MAG: nuclear transport factor 2 family protein [Kofleriaceae bacterium]